MSQVPPPFQPSAPMPRRDKGPMIILFIILALVAFCVIGIVALGFLGFNFFKKTVGPMAGCLVSYQVTRDAILEYANSHDGKLPNAATWQDDVKDIVKKRIREYADQPLIEMIPPDGEWGCKSGSGDMTGMAFNSDLSGKKLAEIKDGYKTPVIFEIDKPKRNANEKYVPRPASTSPTIMGEHRGWITAPLEGEVDMHGGSGNFRMRGSASDGKSDDSSAK